MIFRFFISICFLILVTLSNTYSQCGDELIDRGIKKLDGYDLFKDYIVILSKSKKKFPASASYTIKLERGNVYRFVTETDTTNLEPMIIKVSDDLETFAESHDFVSNTTHDGFDFLCKKTQNYYLTCYYKNGSGGCGAVLVSIVKTYTNF